MQRRVSQVVALTQPFLQRGGRFRRRRRSRVDDVVLSTSASGWFCTVLVDRCVQGNDEVNGRPVVLDGVVGADGRLFLQESLEMDLAFGTRQGFRDGPQQLQ